MRREERIKDLIILGLAKNRKEAEKAIKIAEEYEKVQEFEISNIQDRI